MQVMCDYVCYVCMYSTVYVAGYHYYDVICMVCMCTYIYIYIYIYVCCLHLYNVNREQ